MEVKRDDAEMSDKAIRCEQTSFGAVGLTSLRRNTTTTITIVKDTLYRIHILIT